MLFVAAVVFGYFSYRRLPLALMPELSYPTITVRTEYPGAAPEEVENDVSRPLEDALGVIGGLKRISSVSRAGLSDVILEFSWDTEMSDAVQDALEKLDLVFLPDEANRPLILRFDPSLDPVMELSLSSARADGAGEAELRRVRRIADLQVKRALEPIKGVAAVRVRGGLEEEIQVRLDEGKLRQAGLSIQNVIQRLKQENINVAGGTIKEGRTEYMVRTLSEYRDLEEIEDTVVSLVGGRKVRIKDLGAVVRGHKEREISTRTDGGESVQIDIFKEADANIVALAKQVKAALGTERPWDAAPEDEGAKAAGDGRGTPGGRGPPGSQGPKGLAAQLFDSESVKLTVVADHSLFIESSINEVRNTAMIGGLLAVVVLFLFLKNVKSTLIIAVSIPISLVVTFAPLNVLGVSLNIMSLGGLALGIGMLVDSSIVVLESIYRCREEGDGLVAATIRGADEVRAAVVASILTSIAVFLPMVFVEGVAGQAFGDLGLAVVISLLVSMIVALSFIPMLASRRSMNLDGGDRRKVRLSGYASWAAFRADMGRPGWSWRLLLVPYLVARLVLGSVLELVAKLFTGVVLLVVWLLRRLLVPALGTVFRVLAWGPVRVADAAMAGLNGAYPRVLRWSLANPMAIVILTIACFWVTYDAARSLESELLPEVHQGEFTVEVALPVGTPLEETVAVLTPVEQAILAEKEHIQSLIVTMGYDVASSQRSDEGEHTARFKVLLEETRDNMATEEKVVERLRERFARISDLRARVTRPVLFSFHTPIEVEVHGEDLDRLRSIGDRVRNELATMPQLADVESTLRAGAPEVEIVYDRESLMRYGLNVAEVAELVKNEVKGNLATRLNLKDRRVPIVVRLDESDRESVEDVRSLTINPQGDRPIPVSAIASIALGEGPSEVRRIDGHRVALIRANIARGSLGSAVQAVDARLRSAIDWPTDMTYLIAGQNEEWDRSKGSLWLALGLSIFLVYVIMAAQFESLLHPFVIMFTIPLAFLGTFVTLRLLDISLSIVVLLGMIMLAGIVVNNAIVLVDYINTVRRRGVDLSEAVVTAGTVRLRPILMTTATTVLGLLPMALGFGDGAEIRTPMAITVISGLVSSTVLTLVIIPTIYHGLEQLRGRLVGPAAGMATADAESAAEVGIEGARP